MSSKSDAPKKTRRSRAKAPDPATIRLDSIGMISNFDGYLVRPVFGTAFARGSRPCFEQVGTGALRRAWAAPSKAGSPELWLVAGIQHGMAGTHDAVDASEKDNQTFFIQLGVLGRIEGLRAPSSIEDIDAINDQRRELVEKWGLGVLAEAHVLEEEGARLHQASCASTESIDIGRGLPANPSNEETRRL